MIYIGIHEFKDGSIKVEADEYMDKDEAYESMERNDTNLIVFSIAEFEKIYELLKEKESFDLTKIENADKEYFKKRYQEWEKQRDTVEIGMLCHVKIVCDGCGARFTATVRQTLPPCPECGSYNTYEYETTSVG